MISAGRRVKKMDCSWSSATCLCRCRIVFVGARGSGIDRRRGRLAGSGRMGFRPFISLKTFLRIFFSVHLYISTAAAIGWRFMPQAFLNGDRRRRIIIFQATLIVRETGQYKGFRVRNLNRTINDTLSGSEWVLRWKLGLPYILAADWNSISCRLKDADPGTCRCTIIWLRSTFL